MTQKGDEGGRENKRPNYIPLAKAPFGESRVIQVEHHPSDGNYVVVQQAIEQVGRTKVSLGHRSLIVVDREGLFQLADLLCAACEQVLKGSPVFSGESAQHVFSYADFLDQIMGD